MGQLEGDSMANIAITLVVLAQLAVEAAGIFAIVYFGARLAIRHERRTST
jgi:hypothetical protein